MQYFKCTFISGSDLYLCVWFVFPPLSLPCGDNLDFYL